MPEAETNPRFLPGLESFTFSHYAKRYRHPLIGWTTEGVEYLCFHANAYWLIGLIVATREHILPARYKAYSIHTLTTDQKTGRAVYTVDDGDHKILYTRKIRRADFPLPEISLVYHDRTIMLGSEAG